MAANPYQAPRANLDRADEPEEFQPVKVFSASGRIGRVRYIGYSIGLSFIIMLIAGILSGISGAILPAAAFAFMGIGYVLVLVVHFLLTIQRSHDFNVTGWLSLLSIVPFGVLIFWFVPGTRGENRWGPETVPNSRGAVWLAMLLPLVAIMGIVAAIALPAYQDYVKRAQQVQQR